MSASTGLATTPSCATSRIEIVNRQSPNRKSEGSRVRKDLDAVERLVGEASDGAKRDLVVGQRARIAGARCRAERRLLHRQRQRQRYR